MRAAVVALLLAVPGFVATRGGLFRPDPVIRAFALAEQAVLAHASGKSGELAANSLLPVGYWTLLIEAYPDLSFARYARRMDGGDAANLVARWAVRELARLGHPPVKPLLLERLSSPDPAVRAHAVRLLGLFMDPSITAHLLARMPDRTDDSDSNQMASDILRAATTSRPPDAEAAARALERYAKDDSSFWFGTDAARLRLEFFAAADPVRAAERLLLKSGPEGPGESSRNGCPPTRPGRD